MSTFRYERRPPATRCTRCGRPLWGGDVARVALLNREDPRAGVVRECWPCAPKVGEGPAAAWAWRVG